MPFPLEQLRHRRIGVDGEVGATVDQPADELGVDVVAVLVGDQHRSTSIDPRSTSPDSKVWKPGSISVP